MATWQDAKVPVNDAPEPFGAEHLSRTGTMSARDVGRAFLLAHVAHAALHCTVQRRQVCSAPLTWPLTYSAHT